MMQTKTRKKTMTCLALLGLALPTLALAGTLPAPDGSSAWTIYAFANTNVLWHILTAASGMVKYPAFVHFLEFLAMIGLIGTIIMVGMGGKGAKSIAVLFITATLFITVGINTTMNIVIQDTVASGPGGTMPVKTVTDVPVLVGLPEAVVSTIGYELTKMLRTFYTIPDDLGVIGGGAFNVGTSLINASTHVKITDPNLRATIAAFASNCIVPSIVAGRLSTYRLTTTDQLWGAGGYLKNVNPAPLTPVYTDTQPQGVMTTCGAPAGAMAYPMTSPSNGDPSVTAPNAYKYISQYIEVAAPRWFAQGAGAWMSTGAYSWLSETLSSAQAHLFAGKLTQPTGETIQQAAAINAMGPALNAAAIASGQSKMVTAMAVAQGEKSQVSQWTTAVSLFQDLSGYIYSVLQAFLVAMTPVLFAAAFIPGTGWTMLKSYIHITLWLALWTPTLSIINFIVTLYAQGQLPGALGPSGGGYSMISMHMTSEMTAHLILAAGFLATMTPLITWALVRGSFAFTEFLAHGMGAQMAGMAGSMAATGNISLGNESYDNVSMDQHMMASTITTGNHSPNNIGTTGMGWNTVENTVGGNTVGKTAAGITSSSVRNESRAAFSHSAQVAENASTKARTELDQSLRAATNASRALNTQVSEGHSGDHKVSSAETASTMASAMELGKIAVDHGYMSSQDLQRSHDQFQKLQANPAALADSVGSFVRDIRHNKKLAAEAAGGEAAEGKAGAQPRSYGSPNMVSSPVGAGGKLSNSDNLKGSAGVKTSRGTNSQDNAQTGDQANFADALSDVYQNLSSLTKGASETASQGYAQASKLAHEAGVDYQTATRAEEASSASVAVAANLAFPGYDGQGGALEAILRANQQRKAHAPGNNIWSGVDAYQKGVGDKTGNSLRLEGASQTEAAVNGDLNPAPEALGSAAGRVGDANHKLAGFSTQYNDFQAQVASHRNVASEGADTTQTKAQDQVAARKETVETERKENIERTGDLGGQVKGAIGKNPYSAVDMPGYEGKSSQIGQMTDAATLGAVGGLANIPILGHLAGVGVMGFVGASAIEQHIAPDFGSGTQSLFGQGHVRTIDLSSIRAGKTGQEDEGDEK